MTRRGQAKAVLNAIERVLPDIERGLREGGRADGISVGDRLALRRLLQCRPELAEPEKVEQLGWAVSAVLARSSEEAAVIRRAWGRYRAPATPARMPLKAVGGVALVLMIAGVSYALVDVCRWWPGASFCRGPTSEAVATESSPQDPSKPKPPPTTTADCEVVRTADTSTIAYSGKQRTIRPLTWADAGSTGAGALMVFTGLLLLLRPRRSPELPEKDDDDDDEVRNFDSNDEALQAAYKKAQAAYDAQRLKGYVERVYHVAQTSPVARRAVVESGGVLGRLRHPVRGRALDEVKTVKSTADASGVFVPRFRRRHRPKGLLVLVDVESGNHVWLGAVRRVLLDWGRMGVGLDIFEFPFAPRTLHPVGSARSYDLNRVLCQFPDAPVLLISRRIDRDPGDFLQRPDWLVTLTRGHTCAWLDPSPEVPSPGRARQVMAFEASGLSRFLLNERSLVNLAHYLVTDGQFAERSKASLWLDPSAPELQEPLRRWATAALLVPEASWDDIELDRADARLNK
ncbi:MAG: hypothetical protein AAF449_12400 [Myxococcota bacterium]